jgi:DMSO/TMAO reductase YedYZ molybdopterin-dependent catalytic subunit
MGSRVAWAAAGMAAGAVAIGVAEIVAGLLAGTSVVAAVGALVIDLQPPGGKDLMVALFGTNDKLALEIGTFVGGLLVGTLVGLVARRDVRLGYLGFVAFGAVATVLLLRDPLEDMLTAALTVGPAVAAGIAMLSWLGNMLRAVNRRPPTTAGEEPAATTSTPVGKPIARRAFLGIAAMFVAVGGVLTVIGRFLGGQVPGVAAMPDSIPAPRETVPPMPAGAELAIAGLTPIVVPNDDFYQIDTRLGTPHVDSATWQLRIHGMVEREVTLSYADLLAMPLVERYVTIACVSNEVGGRLVGNAKWTGVSLNSVLERAGVQQAATQLVGRSFDGWTCGFPTAHLQGAGREALIAIQMNGEPLPARHGFPARLIVPGLYGYVSATKWLTELELTTWEAFNAYWIRLGWAKEGPILTQSRIELPRPAASVAAGDVTFAGVAWAPTRGIAAVEVELDESGAWQPAELSVPLSDYSWVQWQVALPVSGGQHTVRVRATDGTGALQEIGPTPPAPDGARGYHRISFSAA